LGQLQADRQFTLRPAFAQAQFADLRADHIQLRWLFINAGTLAIANRQSCRLYLPLLGGICLTTNLEM
jgi:hypothetical protein